MTCLSSHFSWSSLGMSHQYMEEKQAFSLSEIRMENPLEMLLYCLRLKRMAEQPWKSTEKYWVHDMWNCSGAHKVKFSKCWAHSATLSTTSIHWCSHHHFHSIAPSTIPCFCMAHVAHMGPSMALIRKTVCGYGDSLSLHLFKMCWTSWRSMLPMWCQGEYTWSTTHRYMYSIMSSLYQHACNNLVQIKSISYKKDYFLIMRYNAHKSLTTFGQDVYDLQ